jgi:hypothetical protein
MMVLYINQITLCGERKESVPDYCTTARGNIQKETNKICDKVSDHFASKEGLHITHSASVPSHTIFHTVNSRW